MELKHRGTSIYKDIYALIDHWESQTRISDASTPDQAERLRLAHERVIEAGKEFDTKLRTDATIVLRELRSRIPYEARKQIPAIPTFEPADPRAGALITLDIPLGPEFSFGMMKPLARELEELVKLLPDR